MIERDVIPTAGRSFASGQVTESDRREEGMRILAITPLKAYDVQTGALQLGGRTMRNRRYTALRDVQDHPKAVTVIARGLRDPDYGDHNAIIYVDEDPIGAAGGHYLAKIEDDFPGPSGD
jgi:hypothetical protein